MIFGKKRQLVNVCPPVTRAEVWKRAGAIRPPDNPNREDFALELAYDAHKEIVWLLPGYTSEPIDPHVAEAMERQYGPQGVILLDESRSFLDQRIEGLQRAIEFYNQRGDGEMLKFDVALTEQQKKLMTRDLQGFRINQEREKILRDFLDNLILERDTAPDAAVA